jgi:hypothetical protein
VAPKMPNAGFANMVIFNGFELFRPTCTRRGVERPLRKCWVTQAHPAPRRTQPRLIGTEHRAFTSKPGIHAQLGKLKFPADSPLASKDSGHKKQVWPYFGPIEARKFRASIDRLSQI